ncbi:hypothetical protein BDV25DRAFT_40809 [Aspergillus avenaceus]|uniref:NAD(P)-binding protein n=1 Tax=Aspergillus avenaceus TaxID=36643 RepID=A0A5N6TL47_ASPAV|nr:hypothetical protein BDV25DRAFT_40809 [Aspergillus avenaceus]
MAPKLANKNILLIGGTAGIGLAVAKEALESGANITITSSTEERVNQARDTLSAIKPEPSRVRTYIADLSVKDKLEETIENLLKFTAEAGPIDHIVFTAGDVPPMVPLADASFGHFEAFLTVRFFGAMAVGKYAPKYMAQSKQSSITLTTGTQTQKPTFWMPPAVGGALEGLMKGLAVTLAPVRVNAVAPGFILTDLHQSLPEKYIESAVEKYTAQSLTGNIGYPEDAAEAYIYLMKDSFATASIVNTNGGILLA